MPVSDTDILLKFSVKTGAAGNTTASDGDNSLGKYISTTLIADATLHELFDEVTGEENALSDTEYRCIFIHNNHGSISYETVTVYLLTEVAGGADIAIGPDPTPASAIGSASAQALEVVDEDTLPAGLSFTSPTTLPTAIALGDIPAGECKAFWIRRQANDTGPLTGDGVTFRISGESL